MKRLLILAGLLTATVLAYFGAQWYFAHRQVSLPPPAADPLAWMQAELQIDDATLAKVRALHDSYQPVCGRMCMQIAEANARVRSLLDQSRTMTPDLETAIREAQLRQADCRTAMLRHIYETSALLPPEAGQRYLKMVTARLVADGLCPSGMCISDVTEKNP